MRSLAVATLLAVLLSCPEAAFSGSAQIFVHPTLVTLDDRQRSATVNIVNRGDATGTFSIGWVDYAMNDEGGLTVWDGDAPWSLQPHIRYSPRRVTLRPGETQLVRIALRRGQGAAEGEYYSHLKVVTLNDDVNAAVNRQETGEEETRRPVTVSARSAIAVPVVWRNSRAEPQAVIDSVAFDAELHELSVDVRRIGALSTRGYLHVLLTSQDGSRQALADPMPLVIYPSVERRVASVALKAAIGSVDPGIDPGIHMEVVYSLDMDLDGAKPGLASYRLTRW